MSSGRVIQPRSQQMGGMNNQTQYNQPGMQQGSQPGQPHQFAAPGVPGSQALAAISHLAGVAKRGIANQTQGAGWGFSHERHNTALTGEFGKFKEDLVTDEMFRIEYLTYASELGAMAMQAIARRNERGGFYGAFLSGLELVRAGNPNIPGQVEPIREEFFKEIQSNTNIYQHILSNTIIQVVGDLTGMQVQGRHVNQDGSDIRRLLTECAGVCSWFMLVEYIHSHPQSASLIGSLTPFTRKYLTNLEAYYQVFKSRYEQVGPEAQIPWGVSKVTEILKGPSIHNPLLDPGLWANPQSNPSHHTAAQHRIDGGLGLMGQLPGGNGIPYGHQEGPKSDLDAFCENVMRQSREAQEKEEREKRGVYFANNEMTHGPAFTDLDRQIPPLDQFTWENAKFFDMCDYLITIPNSKYSVMTIENAAALITHFRFRNTERMCSTVDVLGHSPEDVPIFRFDMERRCADIRYVRMSFEEHGYDMYEKVLTNPELLLPYMWEEDGQVITNWHPRAVTTDELIGEGNVLKPLSPMVPLEERPNILFGNKRVTFTEDDVMLSKLDSYAKTFDPKGTLDAFVLPVQMVGNLTMDSTMDLSTHYAEIESLFSLEKIKEHGDYFNTLRAIERFLKTARNAPMYHFVTQHITTVVNRWLIEHRGYNELGTGKHCLHVENIFKDLNDFKEYLINKDQPTLISFLKGGNRSCLYNDVRIFATQEKAKEHFTKNVDKEDVVEMAAAENMVKTDLLLNSDAIIIQLRQDYSPVSDGTVRVEESRNPRLFAIIREALETTKKHFQEEPTILLVHEKSPGSRVRSVKFSEFDDSVLSMRALDKSCGLLLGVPATLPETIDHIQQR